MPPGRPPPSLFVLALVALLAPPARASDAPAQPGLTALEAGPFARADAVIAGTVAQVTDLQSPGGALGQQIVRVRVARTFKGAPREGEVVTVLVFGQRPALDPDRPSVPYFRPHTRDRFVLFLGRAPQGVAYRLQTLYDAHDRAGAEKEAAVAAVAEIAALADARARGAKTLAWLLAGLKAPGTWTKAHAARELVFLAGRRPELFDEAVQASLRRTPSAGLTPDQRFWLRRLFDLLDRAPTRGAAPVEPAEGDPWRAAFLEAADAEARQSLLLPLLRTPGDGLEPHGWWAYRRSEPSLRAWFLRTLSERDARATVADVRAAYAGEDDDAVRAEIVRAVGLLGSDEDVPWLAERVGNLALARAALLALARIRTPRALAHLEAAQAAAQRAGAADQAAWLEHLLDPAFVQGERRAGRPVGPR